MNCKQKRKKNDKSFIITKSMTKDILHPGTAPSVVQGGHMTTST